MPDNGDAWDQVVRGPHHAVRLDAVDLGEVSVRDGCVDLTVKPHQELAQRCRRPLTGGNVGELGS